MQKAAEVHDDVNLILHCVGGTYHLSFADKHDAEIFPHLVRPDCEFIRSAKNINFVARDSKGTRKRVSCDFENEKIAEKTLEKLLDARDSTIYDDE